MKPVLIAALLTLTACASSGDLKQSLPDQVLTSSKTARSASICINEKLEDMFSLSKVSARPTETGYAVTIYDLGFARNAIYYIETQDSTPTGSTTKIYKGMIIGGKVIDTVKSCM